MAKRKPKPPKPDWVPSLFPRVASASLDMLSAELMQRNPYVLAQHLFTRGHLLQAQAAALACTDGDFKGECFYQGKDPHAEASRIVRDIWSAELVANIQQHKAFVARLSAPPRAQGFSYQERTECEQ